MGSENFVAHLRSSKPYNFLCQFTEERDRIEKLTKAGNHVEVAKSLEFLGQLNKSFQASCQEHLGSLTSDDEISKRFKGWYDEQWQLADKFEFKIKTWLININKARESNSTHGDDHNKTSASVSSLSDGENKTICDAEELAERRTAMQRIQLDAEESKKRLERKRRELEFKRKIEEQRRLLIMQEEDEALRREVAEEEERLKYEAKLASIDSLIDATNCINISFDALSLADNNSKAQNAALIPQNKGALPSMPQNNNNFQWQLQPSLSQTSAPLNANAPIFPPPPAFHNASNHMQATMQTANPAMYGAQKFTAPPPITSYCNNYSGSPALQNDHLAVLARLQLPRTEIPTFSGNHLKFRAFLLAFQNKIINQGARPEEKFDYLLQYTSVKPTI